VASALRFSVMHHGFQEFRSSFHWLAFRSPFTIGHSN